MRVLLICISFSFSLSLFKNFRLDKIVENIENKEDQIKARAEARLRTKAVEERKVQQSREPSQITINELPGNLRLITVRKKEKEELKKT